MNSTAQHKKHSDAAAQVKFSVGTCIHFSERKKFQSSLQKNVIDALLISHLSTDEMCSCHKINSFLELDFGSFLINELEV